MRALATTDFTNSTLSLQGLFANLTSQEEIILQKHCTWQMSAVAHSESQSKAELVVQKLKRGLAFISHFEEKNKYIRHGKEFDAGISNVPSEF